MLFAHAGEDHSEVAESGSSLLETLAHQPVWVALAVSLFVLLGWFAILGLFKVKLIPRLLALLPVIILLALLFFAHNPAVASILLSAGFILVFILAFTMLRAGR